MQSFLEIPEAMADQQIKIEVAALRKSVEQSDERTRTLGTKLENLKDYVHQELKVDVAIVKDRTALLMWVGGIGFSALFGFMIFLATQLYQINGKLSGLDQQTQTLAKTVSGIHLTQLSSDPSSSQNIAEVKQVLSSAKTKQVKISPSVIDQTGKKFVEASGKNPAAWDAALAFINYKSFLTASPLEAVSRTQIVGEIRITGYQTPIGAGPMYSLGQSKPPDVPALRPLSQLDLNSGKTYGPLFLMIDGGNIQIDSFYMKRVILKNVHVIYRGGPLILDNVYFVNCTFDIPPQSQAGTEFANKILDQLPSVTAKIG